MNTIGDRQNARHFALVQHRGQARRLFWAHQIGQPGQVDPAPPCRGRARPTRPAAGWTLPHRAQPRGGIDRHSPPWPPSARVTHPVETDETGYPLDISLFCPYAVMPDANGMANQIKQLWRRLPLNFSCPFCQPLNTVRIYSCMPKTLPTQDFQPDHLPAYWTRGRNIRHFRRLLLVMRHSSKWRLKTEQTN